MKGFPFLVNNTVLTDPAQTFAAEYLVEEKVTEADTWVAAEDFAYYSQLADSCFFLLGTGGDQKNTRSSLYTPAFNIDENALQHSIGLMAISPFGYLATGLIKGEPY